MLGHVVTASELTALQRRIDEIMLGTAKINYDNVMMQLDIGGDDYGKLGKQTTGHKGPTLGYRKIQNLEFDPVFLRCVQHPVFREVCARIYGPDASIAVHRAMFMNKPARKGTVLPWHQDAWVPRFDPQPLLTVWTALDSAMVDNGCVQIVPGSHKHGIINPEHGAGFLDQEHIAEYCEGRPMVFIELEAGEVALLHNWTLHRSGVNQTDVSRRGFSANYMDASTKVMGDRHYSVVMGEGALVPEVLEASMGS